MTPALHRRLAHLGIAVVALLPMNLAAADNTSPVDGYHMFVGMDVELPFEGELHPMRRLVNRNRDAEIVVDGTPHHVSINRSETMRLKRGLKVGRARAHIGELEAVRSHSIGNNPFMQAARTEMAVQTQAMELMDQAHGQYIYDSLGAVNANTAEAVTVEAQKAIMGRAEENLMGQINRKPVYDYTQLSHRTASALADSDTHDAIEATFMLSSPEPVADVDLVLVADYTVPGKNDEIRRLVYTRALGAIGPDPRRERVWVQGLPPGFQLQETTVHLYTWGEELATNLSEKAVPMSHDQALGVMMADHLNRHRRDTVPARPIWITAPPNFRAMIDISALPAEAVIQVDQEGRVTAVSSTDGQPLRLPTLARRVLTETRFYPALDQGQPIASTLHVELARFLQ